ncbi:MAG: type II toxin-antitoxin system RelB/DinJ family antitoxin [Fibrobacter sp.]|nr:type II toxin-antitoxin system RelB/DinJ family antitoxin [Fibrobacter sp.]
MATSILQIRVDDKLKDEVSSLFESLGMDIPTAVRIFLNVRSLNGGFHLMCQNVLR